MKTRSVLFSATVALVACAPHVTAPPATPAPVATAAPPAAASASAPPDEAPTVDPKRDEIVQKNIDARGGIDRLRALRSLRLTGTAKFSTGDFSIESVYAMEIERPGRLRTEVTRQGLTAVTAFDGTGAWNMQPFGGRREPFRSSADDTKGVADRADIDGPLVDWRNKGHRVSYLGTEEIDGTAAHRLRVRLKDGDVEYHYLDPDSFLEIRVTRESRTRGAESVSEVDFGDYEQVGGVWMPFSMSSGQKGEPKFAHLNIARAESNVAIDDADFRFPGPGTKVVRTILPGPASAPVAEGAPPPPAGAGAPVFDTGTISGLGARNIGSATMSGRVSAVAAYDADGKTTIYVGAASGGVWKSQDGGTTFKPVFDKQSVQSIGAIAIDPSNRNNVWVGTGEGWVRNSVSIGDGIYKSEDAGATWKNAGLPASERVTRVVVDPRHGDTVYACVPGKLWSDSAERGVYRTTDGGKSWALVLKGANLSTGCSGLSMDPRSPDVLFAGMWDFRRKGWTFRSGGEGPNAPSASGMFRSTDGGTTWTPLTDSANKGLPAAPWGRVEVAVAPSDSKIVYALIESKDSALYRSSDGGATWERRDSSQNVVWRPFYFARLVIDPVNPDRVFKPDLHLVVSEDGGKSFSGASGGTHADSHDLWIDPANPRHILCGDDGGLWTSIDGGSRWWKSENLPISQFYHVALDSKDPYQVYGGLQDNSTWVGDSSYPGGITNSRWENLYDGDGFWAVVDPTDPDAVYVESQGGEISRVDRKTRASRNIKPQAAYKEKLRFNWNTPIYASPTQAGTIYIGAQFLFRSRDRGDTWERASPDLSTNDKEKQRQEEAGGVTVDNSSAEMHTTIYSISESPRDARVLWVGTDDGNVQLSRDAGRTWNNVVANVPGLPPASWVSWVEASRFDAGTAYAAFDRHTFGDMTPWVYRTSDFGKTWTRIASPEKGVRGYAHVVKEDTIKKDLLFVGTELGLWISIDGGASWAEFKGGDFPSVAVRDLQVHAREGDLVLATHGRGIWVVDDITPLRNLTTDTLSKPAAFLGGRPVQQRMSGNGGWSDGDATFTGQDAPGGAIITYYQRARHLYGPIKIEVLDPSGKVVDTVDATTRRGINRVVWAMRTKPPRVPRAAQVAYEASQGPRFLPGTYTVRLTKGGQVLETKLVVGLDRRAPYTVADRKAQFDTMLRARALFDDMSALTDRIDAARAGAEARRAKLPPGDPLAAKIEALAHKLDDAKRKIVATKEGGAITGEERIREHLAQVYGAVIDWEGRPAKHQAERIGALRRELDDVQAEFSALASNDVKAIDAELRAKNLDPIPTTASNDGDDDETEADPEAVAAALRCVSTGGQACKEAERAAAARAQRD